MDNAIVVSSDSEPEINPPPPPQRSPPPSIRVRIKRLNWKITLELLNAVIRTNERLFARIKDLERILQVLQVGVQ